MSGTGFYESNDPTDSRDKCTQNRRSLQHRPTYMPRVFPMVICLWMSKSTKTNGVVLEQTLSQVKSSTGTSTERNER